MTNRFLSSRYDEIIQDLAIGVEPLDAYRDARVPPPLYLVRDVPLTNEARVELREMRKHVTHRFPRVYRSNTCRFKLLYSEAAFDAADPQLRVRLVQGFTDYAPRHFVPRRLQIPLQSLADADLDVPPIARRMHRPMLFPGADYPMHETATGVRGRVTRGGQPMPWARIEARRIADGQVVGRAHGDDRGEFLLLLNPEAGAGMGAQMFVTVRVFVHAPNPAPALPAALERETDPLWSLPIEVLPLTADTSNAVARGEQLPPTYTVNTSRDLVLRLGMIRSDLDPYIIP